MLLLSECFYMNELTRKYIIGIKLSMYISDVIARNYPETNQINNFY